MKEERDVLRDAIVTEKPQEESKVKNYILIALGFIALAILFLAFVMAAWRKYGG